MAPKYWTENVLKCPKFWNLDKSGFWKMGPFEYSTQMSGILLSRIQIITVSCLPLWGKILRQKLDGASRQVDDVNTIMKLDFCRLAILVRSPQGKICARES